MIHPIITANRYLTLATCNDNGDVWIAPLAYVYDPKEEIFYFYSAKKSKHSSHITINPKAAIAIFDSSASSEAVEGLQLAVQVEEVKDPELADVINFYFKQSFPDVEERKKWQRPKTCFMGDAPQRFYKIMPMDLFVNDVDDDMIDYRKKIDLTIL